MSKTIKVLVADDHPIFRHGLCMLINAEKDLVLAGEAENGVIALEQVEKSNPDVIILDLDMPIMDGVETARNLQQNFPKIKIIFLTMHKDREILNILKPLNIKGYVLKDSAVIEIVECIKMVMEDKSYISPEITDILLGEISQDSQQRIHLSKLSLLTSAEKRILRFIAESKTNREIAEILFISIRTVENHRFNICAKLNIKGNHSLFKFALTNKLQILDSNNN